jgi:hypothetical protein
MYGSFHICITTGSMAAISGVSAIIQNQFIKYLRHNFDEKFDGDVAKVCRMGGLLIKVPH